MKIAPDNHSQVLHWLLGELHGGNEFSKADYWSWLEQVSVTARIRSNRNMVAVDACRLQSILEYLHDSEADHYDPETYPDDVNDHVYAHVLAIEADLKARAKEGAR